MRKILGFITALLVLLQTFAWADYAKRTEAQYVFLDTSEFDNNLSAADYNLQLALNTLDELAGGGGSGDITSVVAGAGLTGGAASGAATLDVGEGFGLDVVADAIALDLTEITGNRTWADGSDATIAHTYNLSGTDVVLTYSSGALAVTGNLSASNISGTNTGDQTTISGNAGTATALASDPSNCVTSTHFAVGINASGVPDCEAISDADVPNNITVDLATLATTASTANAGDSATAFFSSGTLEHERGGLEADISAYDGLIGITGGATYNVTGTTTQIVIFDGAGAPTVAALSGDATMSNAGVVTVADNSHAHDGTTISGLTNADLSGSAGITIANTAITAGRSLTISTNDILADAELYTFSKTIYIETPTASDDLKTIWVPATNATLVSISCESDQTVNFDLQVDDGSPAGVNGSDIACTTFATDSSLAGDTTIASGERLDLAIASVSGTPTWVSITWSYTNDD